MNIRGSEAEHSTSAAHRSAATHWNKVKKRLFSLPPSRGAEPCPAAMDPGKGTSAENNHHASVPVRARKGGKVSWSRAAAPTQTRCSTKCASASETPRSDEAQEPQHRPWADLPPDILGVVVGRLPLVEDRARLRSVCHAWRAAARLHRRRRCPCS